MQSSEYLHVLACDGINDPFIESVNATITLF